MIRETMVMDELIELARKGINNTSNTDSKNLVLSVFAGVCNRLIG